jgi:hypothetical protein
MLPDFPTVRRSLDEAVRFRINAQSRAKSVIASMIHGITQHEGTQLSYHQEGTGTVTRGYEELVQPLTISFDEIPDLMGDRLNAVIDSIADGIAKKTSESFYKMMDEITARTGNVSNGLMSQEAVVEMLERTEWSPSSVFIAHPTVAKAMGEKWQEWQSDAEFMKKYKEVDRRKKEAWRDRESNRKLVD